MNTFRRIAAAASVLLTPVVGFAIPTSARAAVVSPSCGDVIHATTTLGADLSCPDGDGLVVEGTGITLNLNGHTVSGQLDTRTVSQPTGIGDNGVLGAPYTVRFATGQFAGIRVHGNRNTISGPGAVKFFAAGVVIEGGSGNKVIGLTVSGNLGPPNTQDLGDGILLVNSNANKIVSNTVADNGPFDGIGLVGDVGGNLIDRNVVTNNRQPEICPEFDVYRFSVSGGGVELYCGPSHPVRKPFTFINQQNQGIKLEGQGALSAHHNIVSNNVVTNNGNTGIFIPSQCPELSMTPNCPGQANHDNIIRSNQSNHNGFGYPTGPPSRSVFEGPTNGGSGIILMIGGPKPPFRNTITRNTANDNAAHGIAVLPHRPGNGDTNSVFTENTALGNNASPAGESTSSFPNYNGYDGNAVNNPDKPCDNNIWRNNNFGRSYADIHGPVPPNNLANTPCVGPVLPPSSSPGAAAQAAGGDDGTILSRHWVAPAPSR